MVIDGEEGLCSNSLIFRASTFARFARHYWNFAKTRDAARAAAGPFRPISCHTRRDTQRGWAIPSSRPISVEYSFFPLVVCIRVRGGHFIWSDGPVRSVPNFALGLLYFSNGRHSSCFFRPVRSTGFSKELFYMFSSHPVWSTGISKGFILHHWNLRQRRNLFYMLASRPVRILRQRRNLRH